MKEKNLKMAAKLLHSLADENPDLQKQIGCMTGILQLFDRQHILSGRQLRHRRLPPGISLSQFAFAYCVCLPQKRQAA